MFAVVAPIAALLLSAALLLTGHGLQGTLLPVRAGLEAYSPFDISVLGSSYFVGFMFGCVAGPLFVRRAGHIRTFLAMVGIASSVCLVHALFLDPIIWWVMRAATGMCLAVLYMVIESWLNARSSNENRGFVFSIYVIINLFVMTLGQMMLILADPGEFPLFALASILVSLAAVPIAFTRFSAPEPVETVKIDIGGLFRSSPVGVLGCLTTGLAIGSFWALGPLFAQSSGGDVKTVAYFMSAAVIGGAISQWPIGWISDRLDRRAVLVATCIAAGLAGVGLSIFGAGDIQILIGFGFLFGAFGFPVYALCVAHTNDHVNPDDYVQTASALLLLYGFGAAVGPLLASLVIDFMGVGVLFTFAAVAYLVMTVFTLFRMMRRPPMPEEEQISFADALRIAKTVSTVDVLQPETEEEPDGVVPETAGTPGS